MLILNWRCQSYDIIHETVKSTLKYIKEQYYKMEIKIIFSKRNKIPITEERINKFWFQYLYQREHSRIIQKIVT